MNKQEEIREGIAETLYGFEYDGWDKLSAGNRVMWLARADAVMNKEHSQGVVIKVDRELPDDIVERASNEARTVGEKFVEGKISYNEYISRFNEIFDITNNDLLVAGYVAVEPLIGE